MKSRVHFISGLPRSGSTLLAALLRQNPRFQANVNSPVFQLANAVQMAMSGRSEFYAFFDDTKRFNVLRGIFENYYQDLGDGKVIFDTNRGWCSKLTALVTLFPDAKVICCVRPLGQIVESVERIVQENPLEPSRLFNFEGINNVYSRVDLLSAVPNGLIGAAYAGLKGAFYGPHSDHLLLVNYNSLCRDPGRVLKGIYDFVGEPEFDHRFDNLVFDTPEYDAALGLKGLHRVHPKVTVREHQNILPPDLMKRFQTNEFWLDAAQNSRNVRII